MTSPSAMPTRSAPSSLALALISAAVTRSRYTVTISDSISEHDLVRKPVATFRSCCRFLGLLRRRGTRSLTPFEILQLARDDSLVAVRSDPANVPRVEPVDRLAAPARILARLGESDLLRRLLRN